MYGGCSINYGPIDPEVVNATGYSTSALVMWSAVPAADHYLVEIKESARSANALFAMNSTDLSLLVDSLESETAYVACVTSIDVDGSDYLVGFENCAAFSTIERYASVTLRTTMNITIGNLTMGDSVRYALDGSPLDEVMSDAGSAELYSGIIPGTCYDLEIVNSARVVDRFEECTVPQEPTIVSLMRVTPTDSTLELQFTAPSTGGYSGFIVRYWTDSFTAPMMAANASEPITISGLQPFTVYNVTVRTTFMGLESPPALREISTALSPVSNVTVLEVAFREITIKWTEAPGFEMYNVWVDRNLVESVINSTNYTITSLEAGTQYLISVQNAAEDDELSSDNTTITAMTDDIAPGIILVSESEVTPGIFTLDWANYGDRNYFVIADPNVIASTAPTKDPTDEISFLSGGQEVNLTVIDIDTNELLASTIIRVNPDPVLSMNVSDIDILSANVSWTPPSTPHDAYEIYVTRISTNKRVLAETVEDSQWAVVMNLIPMENYNIEVGTVLYATDSFPRQRSYPSQNKREDILTLGPERGELIVVECSSDFIQVAWGLDPDVSCQHDATATYLTGDDQVSASDIDPVTRMAYFVGLNSGSRYNISVTTCSDSTLSVEAYTAPLAPASVFIESNFTAISLSWDEVSGDNITYDIELSADVCGGISREISSLESLEYVFTDLRLATTYTVSVVAKAGDVKEGDPWTNETMTNSTGVIPGEVTVTQSSKENPSVTVVWLSEAPGYSLLLNGVSLLSGTCADPSILEYVATPSSGLNFTLRADGEPPIVTFFTTYPDPVGGLRITETQPTSATVAWNPPMVGDVDGFLLMLTSYEGDAPEQEEFRVEATMTSYTFDVRPLTNYTIRVQSLLLTPEELTSAVRSEEIMTPSLNSSTVIEIARNETSIWLIHGGSSDSTFNITPSDGARTVPGDFNRLSFFDLTPGQPYHVQILSQNTVIATYEFDLAPTDPIVDVTGVTATSVMLSISPGPSVVQEYMVNYTSLSDDPFSCETVMTVSVTEEEAANYTLSLLHPDHSYQISVRAVSRTTESGATMVTATTDPLLGNGFTVVERSVDSITLAWTSNSSYDISVTSYSGGGTWSTVQELSFTDCSFSRTRTFNLSMPGTTYVVTYLPRGNDVGSFNITVRTDPGPPMSLMVNNVTRTSAWLSWQRPASGEVDSYKVTIVSLNDSQYLPPGDVLTVSPNGIMNGYLLEGLIPSADYDVSVESVLDATEQFETQESSAANVSFTTEDPRENEVLVTMTTNDSIEFLHGVNGTRFTYNITPSDGVTILPDPNDPYRVTFENLQPGLLYSGFIDPGDGNIVPIDDFRLKPSTPTLTTLSTNMSQIELGIDPGPGYRDRFNISFRSVVPREECVHEDSVVLSASTETYTFENLEGGTSYVFTVVSEAGPPVRTHSLEGTQVENTTVIPQDTFTVLDITSDSASLAWVNGQPTPFNITRERKVGSRYVPDGLSQYGDCDMSYVLVAEPLESATEYRFMYVPQSGSPFEVEIRTDPESIFNCSVDTTVSSYTLTWTPAPGSRNDGYRARITDQDGDVQEMVVRPDEELEIFKNRLLPGTNFTFVINAVLDATDTFSAQEAAVPCQIEASTLPLSEGVAIPISVSTTSFMLIIGDARNVPGFQRYEITTDPPINSADVTIDQTTSMATLENLTPGQLYNVTTLVLGTDLVNFFLERTVPLSPATVSSTTTAATSVTVSWARPVGVFDFFRVSVNPTMDTEETSATLTDLLPGTNYTVSVVTVSGTGPYQQISSSTELNITTQMLGPNELEFINVMSTSFTALWGDFAQTYFVVLRDDNDIQAGVNTISDQMVDIPSNDLSAGISAASVYSLEVCSFPTLMPCVNGRVRTNPESPQEPRSPLKSPFALSFEWDATNTSFTGYRVYYLPVPYRRELALTVPRNSSEGRMFSQDCLRPDTEYTYELETYLAATNEFSVQSSDEAQSITIRTSEF
ncbi:fibronectin-like [Diadema antillarum]|uniref:fibronectin-like n=1 Tax=Diadema antillarum TaxID=105358 RepID=UPI003A8428D3